VLDGQAVAPAESRASVIPEGVEVNAARVFPRRRDGNSPYLGASPPGSRAYARLPHEAPRRPQPGAGARPGRRSSPGALPPWPVPKCHSTKKRRPVWTAVCFLPGLGGARSGVRRSALWHPSFPSTAQKIPVRPRLSFHLAWACMEAANCARRYDPLIKRFTQCKQAKTNTLVATKTVAHTWARACYDIMHDQMPFEVQKALRVCTPLRVGWGGELASGVGAKPLSLMSPCPILPPASV
jgi:hypothetical protein